MKPILTYSVGVLLFRQLAAATRNRLPYRETLEILSQDPEIFGRDSPAVQVLIRQMDGGASLSAALRALPELVAPETALLVEAAETHGNLAQILDAIADDFTELAQRRTAVRTALLWPMLIAGAVTMLIVFMMIFVIPSFKTLYSGFGAELPGPTLFIIWVSDAIVDWWWAIGAMGAAVFALKRKNLLPPGLSMAAQRALLGIPFLRTYLVRAFAARMANWLRVAHVNPQLLLAALRHVRATTRMAPFALCLLDLEARLAGAATLSEALLGLAPLPKRFPLLVQLGERMGDIGSALSQAADFAEAERTAGLALFERGLVLFIYCILGAIVAVVVIAMYMPIFSMGQAVS